MEPNFTEPPNAQRSDEELVKLAQSGDFEGAKELFTRYYPMYVSHALRICRDENLAKDAVQEAYKRFACKFNELHPPIKLAAWVKGIIKNVIYEEWKYRKRDGNSGTEHVPTDINNVEDRKNETPGEKLDRKDLEELVGDLPNVLADLDDSHQQIGQIYLEHFRLEEQPPLADDIAKKVGISRHTVFRYRETIEKRWKRLCEKRGFDTSLIDKIFWKKKKPNEPV
jgi:RNA polymerase sigma factor (sigma-70 family)